MFLIYIRKIIHKGSFYTMPCTEVVNKQTEFAKWLYYPDKTCKEDGIKCASYVN